MSDHHEYRQALRKLVDDHGGDARLSTEERGAVRKVLEDIQRLSRTPPPSAEGTLLRDSIDAQLWQLQRSFWSRNLWDWYWKGRAGILVGRDSDPVLVFLWDAVRFVVFVVACGLILAGRGRHASPP
jgi:hypothetical protein